MMPSLVPFTILAVIFVTDAAIAGSNSIGVVVTSERVDDEPGVPQSAKFELTASHTFATGIILGGSLQYSNTAFSDDATLNIEMTAGYRVRVNEALSVVGSLGLGERTQVSGSGSDIAYYVLRSGADLKLNETTTWNAVAFRYRDAFDTADDYLTPQLGTGFTFKLDERSSVSTKLQYNWKDWHPDTIGLAISYEYGF